MPHADVALQDGSETTTNSAGLVEAEGTIATTLAGPFVRINDYCGFIDESTACRDLDLATSGGTDCTTPAGHSLGDTHSSRTGFYEVNRIIEQAKGWLPPTSVPNNPETGWLNRQLTANMNINNFCNAFFSLVDGTINFYRQGGGCRNTGEIAAVFDHEWGTASTSTTTRPASPSPARPTPTSPPSCG
jgi:hypothetical protein